MYTVPAALIIGAPGVYFARMYWPLTRWLVTIVGAGSGVIWAAVSEFRSAEPTFYLLAALIGAVGGLLSFPILARSNNKLQRTRGGSLESNDGSSRKDKVPSPRDIHAALR